MANEDKVTIGAQIPGRLFQLINLYALPAGQSKSQIIRDALLLWANENKVTQDTLIQQLRSEYKNEWWRHVNRPEVSDTVEDKNAFIRSKAERLEKNRVSESIINEIFKDF